MNAKKIPKEELVKRLHRMYAEIVFITESFESGSYYRAYGGTGFHHLGPGFEHGKQVKSKQLQKKFAQLAELSLRASALAALIKDDE
jgi:hypothetical protein